MNYGKNPFLEIQPNIVSKNLESYAFLFAGEYKVGKTRVAMQFPNSVLLEVEKGGHCIPGAKRLPISSWDDLEYKISFLDCEETRNLYSMVIIDTYEKLIKFAYDKIISKYNLKVQDLARKANETVEYMEDMSDVSRIAKTNGNHWNKAYDMVDKLLTKIFKTYGYGLIIICHLSKKNVEVKDQNDSKKTKTITVLDFDVNDRLQKIANELVDVSCLITKQMFVGQDGKPCYKPVCSFRGGLGISTGNRFKYLNGSIEFNYENLRDTIIEAIEKEEAEVGSEYFSSNKQVREEDDSSFDSISEIRKMINLQIATLQKNHQKDFNDEVLPKIKEILIKHLGDKKLDELTAKDSPNAIKARDELLQLV